MKPLFNIVLGNNRFCFYQNDEHVFILSCFEYSTITTCSIWMEIKTRRSGQDLDLACPEFTELVTQSNLCCIEHRKRKWCKFTENPPSL